ncbi:MAG: DUF547 domain-containing protein [Flavobacteriales bacterium]|nr:DUF547 domain-containing protein [Flavobacteriales bacterium]
MVNKLLYLVFFCIPFVSEAKVSHEMWNQLLKKHVSEKGNVNYQGFKTDRELLDKYLFQLAKKAPDQTYSSNEELAYWINAYNAFTIQLVLKYYPMASITNIDKPWDIPFIKIENKTYTLNEIEHQMIRKKFNEPRIHFALVCAAASCPKLRSEAYEAEKIEIQLLSQTIDFINDTTKNTLNKNKAILSELFSWYKEDFTKNGTLADFINQYSKIKIETKTKISFSQYNWKLNE